MSIDTVLSPDYSSTISVTPTTSSVQAALYSTATALPNLLITNTGSVLAYFRTGNSAVASTTAACPILPGQSLTVTANGATHIAAICPTGTTVLTVTRVGGML